MNVNEVYFCGGTAVTIDPNNSVVEDTVIHVKEGRIESISSQKGFKAPPNAKVIDSSDCLVLPGLINCHTHAGMGLFRGVGEDLTVEAWLYKYVFPLERKWDSPSFVHFATTVSLLEMIRTGTTTLNDMYYFEGATARAVQEAGLRGICGQTIAEIGGVQEMVNLQDQFDAFLAEVEDCPLVTPSIAPHSIYGVKQTILEEIIDYCRKRNLKIHMHLSETSHEIEESKKQFSKTPVEYCESLGLLDLDFIAAHAAILSDKDIEILGRHQVGIAHNAESNLKMGTGICPVTRLRKAGARVGLATDGVQSNNNLDLLCEADTATKLQAFREGPGAMTTKQALRLLTLEGAQVLGLDREVGSLEVGKAADIIAVDINNAHSIPLYNPYAHVIYCANGSDVKHSMVAGKILMENWNVLSLDEPAILKEAQVWGKKIRKN